MGGDTSILFGTHTHTHNINNIIIEMPTRFFLRFFLIITCRCDPTVLYRPLPPPVKSKSAKFSDLVVSSAMDLANELLKYCRWWWCWSRSPSDRPSYEPDR